MCLFQLTAYHLSQREARAGAKAETEKMASWLSPACVQLAAHTLQTQLFWDGIAHRRMALLHQLAVRKSHRQYPKASQRTAILPLILPHPG